MIRPTLLIAILSVVACAAGCGPNKPTADQIKAKSEQTAGSGRSRFYEELAGRNVTWYVAGNQASGINVDTGLPEQPISTLPGNMQAPEFVKAHNDAVLEYIRDNGPVPGSFLAWENDLLHQQAFWAMHANQQPDTLRPGTPVSAPGGQYTLSLEASRVIVQSDAGQNQAAFPSGASEATADVIFGPGGSDLAFTRWPAGGGEFVYAAMNLRNGQWISVQRGGPAEGNRGA